MTGQLPRVAHLFLPTRSRFGLFAVRQVSRPFAAKLHLGALVTLALLSGVILGIAVPGAAAGAILGIAACVLACGLAVLIVLLTRALVLPLHRLADAANAIGMPDTPGSAQIAGLMARCTVVELEALRNGLDRARAALDEREAAELRLRGVQADLLRVSRLSAMGAMASGLAHEVNQPLAAATNFLNAAGQLLARDLVPQAGETVSARGAIAEAAQQVVRAGEIVRRLRAFVSRGEAELHPELLADVVRDACEVARADGTTVGCALTLEVAPARAIVMMDRIQMQQVMLNLIRNAAEAVSGRADRQVHVAASVTRAHEVEILVTDNGPGLAAGVADRLFQPFVSSKPDGMGIGLVICRTIVEGHGGTLAAAAGPGGGMVFRILLPNGSKVAICDA